jgi:lipoprotein-anchoring transpeptidase ErfK/SrfK
MKNKKLYIISSIAITTLILGGIFVAYSYTQKNKLAAETEQNSPKTASIDFSNMQESAQNNLTLIKETENQLASKYTKRIEINLSEQKLYCYEGENCVRSFLISSGTFGRTPIGTFTIYSRSRSCLMEGPGYYLPGVQWVNRFYGHLSIHGTYWHHNFGHPMSHGCVNATNEDAQFVYNWAPMGTKVVIHN